MVKSGCDLVFLVFLTSSVLAAACSDEPASSPLADGGAEAQTDAGAHGEGGALGDALEEPLTDRDAAQGAITATDFALTTAGNLVMVGTLEGTVDLGRGALTSAGSFDLVVAAFDAARSVAWNRSFGDADPQAGGSLAIDGAGGIVIATTLRGTLDFGGGAVASAGATDVAVAKLDAEGGHLWSRRWGDAGQQLSAGVATDSVGRIVVGAFSQTPFDFAGAAPDAGSGSSSSIAQLDPSGNVVWSKFWRGAQVTSVAVDSADDVIVAGSFDGAVDFGGGTLTSEGRADIFLVKLSANGEHRWSQRFGGPGSDTATAVATDSQRNLLLTGSFDDTLSFGGSPLVNMTAPTTFTVPFRDIFVAKLDATSAHLWSHSYGDGEADQVGYSVSPDGAGNVLFSGDMGGSIDFGQGPHTAAEGRGFVVQLEPAGATRWSQQLGASGVRVRATAAGGVIVAGGFPLDGNLGSPVARLVGGSHVFLVEYAP